MLFNSLALIAALGMIGCSQRPVPTAEEPAQDQKKQKTEVVEPPAHEPPPAVVYAEGWREFTLVANSAKTQVTIAGHFTTSRNACGYPVWGPIELTLWNKFAKAANQAVKTEFLPAGNEYCIEFPSRFKMDGTVEIKLEDEKKVRLYEMRNWEICSTLSQHALSDELLGYLNDLLILADKEECSRGFGSG